MTAEIIRPERWDAANDVPFAWTRPGHFYRGVSAEDFRKILKRGEIRSDERWCVPGEGTCFSDDAAVAESYANFGRSDPRRTGQSNYLIEVASARPRQDRRDGYWKVIAVPTTEITRAWRMFARDGAVYAQQVRVPRARGTRYR